MAKRDLQKRIDLPGATLTSSAIRVTGGGGGGGGMAAHALFGHYHTGELDRTQATWVATDIATAIATHTAIEDAHHAKQHSITDAAHHTVTGTQYSVVGLSALNTLGVLPSASDVSAAAHTLLRSDSLGGIAVSKVRTPAIDTASGGLSIAPASGTTTITGTTVVTVGVQTPLITSASNVDLVIDAGGTGAVKFPNAQTVRTSTFDSGVPLIKGWQINEVTSGSEYSALTIGKIRANELTVDIFVANETRVDRGDQLWTKSYGILYADFTTPGSLGGTVSITFEDSPAITGAIFTNNDWLLLRKLDINTGFSLFNVWGQVASYTNNSNGSQTWTFTLRQGPTSKLIPKGSLGIDFGASGAAFIHLSVLDAAGAPYIKMRKWVGSDPYTAANYTTYVQIGHLGSIGNTLYTPAGYGLYIRSTASEDQFLVADDNGLQIRGADFKIYESTTPVVAVTRNEGIMLGVGSSESAVEKKSITWHVDLASPSVTPAFGIYGAILTGGDTYGMITSYSATQFSSLYLKAIGPGATTSQIYMRSRTSSDSIIELASDEVSMVAALTRTGVLTVSGNLIVTGGNIAVSGTVDGVDVSAFKAAYDSHNHNSAYLALSGGTLTGTLTGRDFIPSADNTYDIGSATYRVQDLYAVNLHVNNVVGTPSYSHEHATSDITSGTMAEARLPHTYTSALTLDADSTGTSNYLRWLTQTSTGKAWDLVARAHDYATTASQQNDLLLTFYDGSTVNLVWQIDNTTRVMDFGATPSVNGTSVSLSNHNHDASYVPTSRTVTAGAGLTGGGALSSNVTMGHADTSSVGDVANTNGTVLQSVTFDTYGHVQTVASYNLDNRYYTETEIGTILTSYVPTSRTVTAGAGMTGGGALSADITISHLDTSSQTTVTNTGTSFIQSVTLDTYGHITALASADIGTALDSRYVNVTGDTMSGALTAGAGVLISSGAVGTPSLAASGDTDTGIYWPAANTLAFSMGGTQRLQLSSTGGTLTGILSITTATVTPSITTGSGNLALSSTGGTVAVTGALTGSSTATFATSVAVPLVTASSGDLTLNSAAGSVAINAATGQAVNLQVAGATQWAANETRLLPRSSVAVDIGDYNRKIRTLYASEMYVETLVAQDVMATIGGRVMVAPTTTLIADVSVSTSSLFSNLQSYWALDETTGNRVDSKGSNTLTNTNTVGYTAGKQGNASSFAKASSQYLTIADNAELSVGDIDFYTACWIYPTLDDGGDQYIAAKAGGSGNRAWNLYLDWANNRVRFAVYNSSDTATTVNSATNSITVNGWHFVEAWHDSIGNVIGVSVNGTTVTTSHTTGVKNDTGPFQIGARNASGFYQGYIDEFGFWKYMPTSTDRAFLYNSGSGRTYSNISTWSSIDVKHNNLSSGTYIYLQTAPAGVPQIEAMQVVSSATSIAGGYRYQVVRNLDGTGTNAWVAGDAVVSLGASVGQGYIDLTSTSTIHGQLGPTITVFSRTATTAWDSTKPVVSMGNLRSFVDYASDEYGQAAGNDLTLTPATGFKGYTIDRVNGLRLFSTGIKLYNGATQTVNIDSAGQDIWIGTASTDKRLSWNGASLLLNNSDIVLSSSSVETLRMTQAEGIRLQAGSAVQNQIDVYSGASKVYAQWTQLDTTYNNTETLFVSYGKPGLGMGTLTLKSQSSDGVDSAYIAIGSTYVNIVGKPLTIFNGATVNGGLSISAGDIDLNGNDILDIGTIGENWTTLTLNTAGNWINFGGAYYIAGYKKMGDFVFLRGTVKRTSGANTQIATMPVGYRPGAYLVRSTAGDDVFARIDIRTDGTMHLLAGTAASYLSLDGLWFSTA